MLKLLTSIYFEPLGIISPITLTCKEMYRQACNLQLPWDSEHPTFLLKKGSNCQRVCQNNIKFQEAYRYSRMRCNQLTGTYLGTLAKLVFLWICMALPDKQGSDHGLLVSIFTERSFRAKTWICCCTCGYQNPLKDMAANILQNTRAALRRYLIKSCYGLFDNIVVF